MTPEDEALINDIEGIRSANNTNWMDIVRIAMQHDPVRTRATLKRIAAMDELIKDMTTQLSEEKK